MTKQPKRRTRILAAVAPVAAVIAIAGCGGSSTSTTAPAPTTTNPPATITRTPTGAGGATATTPGPNTATTRRGEQTIRVDADPTGRLEFTQTTLTARAGTITFVLKNDSAVPHNLAIGGNGVNVGPSATVSGGTTADLTATLKPGVYDFYCAIPGHKEAGMRGTLTVT